MHRGKAICLINTLKEVNKV